MADIDVDPNALIEFARNSQLDLDVDALKSLAAAASNGQSDVPEGQDLFNAQRDSIQQVMSFLELASLGTQAYRDGADAMAALFQTTDKQLAASMQAAVPTAASDGSSASAASA